MSVDDTESKRAIVDEIERISRDAARSSTAHSKRARFWTMIRLALGVPGVILAALAGSVIVAEWSTSWLPGIFALVAAALVGVMLALSPTRRAKQSEDAAGDYSALRDSVQRVRRLDLPGYGSGEARRAMEDLARRRDELVHRAPPPGRRFEDEAASGEEAVRPPVSPPEQPEPEPGESESQRAA